MDSKKAIPSGPQGKIFCNCVDKFAIILHALTYTHVGHGRIAAIAKLPEDLESNLKNIISLRTTKHIFLCKSGKFYEMKNNNQGRF